MTQQSTRYFLIAALIFVGSILYYQWEGEHSSVRKETENKASIKVENNENKDIPSVPAAQPAKNTATSTATTQALSQELIEVSTDVFELKINPLGGDIVFLKLKKYKTDGKDKEKEAFVLLDESTDRFYIAQSGLTGPNGPDKREVGRAKFTANQQKYEMDPNQDRLEIDLQTTTDNGVNITKQFVFLRNDYTITVSYLIDNNSNEVYQGNFYGRLKRKMDLDASTSYFSVQTFTGAALYTKDTPYKKITFKDIKSKPLSIEEVGGWAAMVEHYFLTAWIPDPGIKYSYQTNALEDGFAIGFISPTVSVAPKTQEVITAKLYAGPEVQDTLAAMSPGLDLTVDYGILWPICKPIFWLLKKLYLLTGNWGVAIILITIIIKALFYKLSESSYRSMATMRKLQPRLETLKERYGEDKQKYSQAVMELYKKEKINPLGGCLPILIQIPVFIALYYVLLGSVELRQAPFILWITDLSAKDPYYVLPILMGITMWIQQRLNPAPPDPIQAKVMMAMPIVFTVLFLNFPSGLVLYWLVNNVLSIAQQWYITKKLSEPVPHGAK